MAFEHIGINVPDAVAMAKWYVENLDMQIVCSDDLPPYTHLLADSTGRTIIKIYSNPNRPVPDYSSQHQLAFATDDPSGLKDELIKVGASLAIDEIAEDGSEVITLRDPWNIPFQLTQLDNSMYEPCPDELVELTLARLKRAAVKPEAAVLYVPLEDVLAQLDASKYGPCPDELVELTLARLRR